MHSHDSRAASSQLRVFAPRSSNIIGNLVLGKHPKTSGRIGMGCRFQQKACNISEMVHDRTKVTIDD